MLETKKALRLKMKNMDADLTGEMEKSNQYAQANKRLMDRDEKLFDDNVKMMKCIDKLNGDMAKVSERLAKAEQERDEWRERYREEAAATSTTGSNALLELLDDMISTHHRALEELYQVRQRMTTRMQVQQIKRD